MSDEPDSTKPTALVALGGKYSHLLAIIDAEDLPKVAGRSWHRAAAPRSLTQYARSGGGKKMVYLHRLIMNAGPGTEINHIDGNGLNNTKANLEFVTHSQNIRYSYTQKAYDEWKRIEAVQILLQTAENGSNDDAR